MDLGLQISYMEDWVKLPPDARPELSEDMVYVERQWGKEILRRCINNRNAGAFGWVLQGQLKKYGAEIKNLVEFKAFMKGGGKS